MRSTCTLAALAALTLTATVACSSGPGGSSGKTITVAYQKFGSFVQLDGHLRKVKAEYEKTHPGTTVKLVPIEAAENDYYTKLSLMNRSPDTAPDVVYEDTFLVNTDIKAGYLAPLDDYLAKWPEWKQFSDTAKTSAQALDGKTYGVPMGTDTRALWYNKGLLHKAGLPVPWQPKDWDEVLSAARTIKAKLPGVTPLNVYSGKAVGEGATMQGFEMLLYGTDDTLYDRSAKKWTASTPGFLDSLDFIKTIYGEKLAPEPQDALNPNIATTDWLPSGKLAIALDGSWLSSTWLKSGTKPWPKWSTTLGQAAMPTQNGSGPGSTSMSGGWVLSVGSRAENKQAAFDFITTALNKENSLAYALAAGQIAERADVAADPRYAEGDPSRKFFTDLVRVTHYRPAYAEYPHVSDAIQVAMEAVMTGQKSPRQAMRDYVHQVTSAVGADKVDSDS